MPQRLSAAGLTPEHLGAQRDAAWPLNPSHPHIFNLRPKLRLVFITQLSNSSARLSSSFKDNKGKELPFVFCLFNTQPGESQLRRNA